MDSSKGLEHQVEELEALLEQAERKSDILTNLLKEATAEFTQSLDKISTSEANFRAIIENAPEAIYILDIETHRIVDCNPYTLDWLGYDRDELTGKRLEEILDPQTVGINENLQQALDRGRVHIQERRFITKSGFLVNAEVTGTIIQYRDRQCFVAFVRDITERKKLEELSRYKELFDSVNDPVIISHSQGNILEVNDVACDRLGYSRRQLLDMCFRQLTLPEQLEVLEQMGRRLRSGQSVQFELDIATCDGSRIPFEFHSRMIEYRSKPAILSVARDLSIRKKMEETLVRQERLYAVGELAAGVAHNFNNLLQIIMGAAEAAQKKLMLGEIENSRKALANIVDGCNRGSDIVKRIKDFTMAKTEDRDRRVFDLGKLVSEAIELTKPLWSKPGTPSLYSLRYRQPEGCMVKGNPSEIYEVLVNLIKNALEAMPSGGTLDIFSEMEKAWVLFHFVDTGQGIPYNDLQRIFEPFFTSKGSKSCGLGLSSSYGIIKKHLGEIRVASTPGESTTFTIVLPRVKEQASEVELTTTPAPFSHELSERIRCLLIDDEVHILKMMQLWFEDTEVLLDTVDSAAAALAAIGRSRYDVIVCDFGLDEMNGLELVARVRSYLEQSNQPPPRFVLCTGLQTQFDPKEIEQAGVDRIFKKPFSAEELLEAIRKVVVNSKVAAH